MAVRRALAGSSATGRRRRPPAGPRVAAEAQAPDRRAVGPHGVGEVFVGPLSERRGDVAIRAQHRPPDRVGAYGLVVEEHTSLRKLRCAGGCLWATRAGAL